MCGERLEPVRAGVQNEGSDAVKRSVTSLLKLLCFRKLYSKGVEVGVLSSTGDVF